MRIVHGLESGRWTGLWVMFRVDSYTAPLTIALGFLDTTENGECSSSSPAINPWRIHSTPLPFLRQIYETALRTQADGNIPRPFETISKDDPDCKEPQKLVLLGNERGRGVRRNGYLSGERGALLGKQ